MPTIFRHHQWIGPDGQVLSVQTLDLLTPLHRLDEATALQAGRFYFRYLRRVGRRLLSVRETPDGRVVIGAAGVRLLSFAAPVIIPLGTGTAVRYPIRSGAVVQPRGRGRGWLEVRLQPHQVALKVDGYYARLVGARESRLRRLIYLSTQSALHVTIARGFLPALARWLQEGSAERPGR